MEIKLSERSGFCFGVKRAVEMAENALSGKRKVYSLGPLIHNPQVIDRLSRKGLVIIDDIAEASQGALIVRSHGLAPAVIQEARDRGLEIIDATCPNVLTVHNILKGLYEKAYEIIVVGDKAHPEVQALMGLVDGNASVLESLEDARCIITKKDKIGIVAQTTQSHDTYMEIAAAFITKGRFREFRLYNTICEDVIRRQEYAKSLAAQADVMLVIGGKISANTRRLVEICENKGAKTFLIETKDEMREEWFNPEDNVGVASGASTPMWIIDEVVAKFKNFKTNA